MKGRDKNGENELDLLSVERRQKEGKKERNVQEKLKLKILKFEFEFQNGNKRAEVIIEKTQKRETEEGRPDLASRSNIKL